MLTSYLSPTSIKLAQDKRYVEILNLARELLIANTVSAYRVDERPGDMPVPDVVADTPATKNYNGYAEVKCFDSSKPNGLPLIADHANLRCLGRLPWRTMKMATETGSENDVAGDMAWYAVSANLAFPKCLDYLNSDIFNFSYTSYVCPIDGVVGTPTSLPHPWLTVRDAQGIVLSNRVAAVIIVPGPQINGQSRPPAPNLAGPNQYLDAATVTITTVTTECPGPPCTLTFSNADLDNDFIQADQSPTFNDRLVYITIDEIMAKTEARAGQEILASVQRFRDSYGTYPWLAPYANPSVLGNYVAVTGTRIGRVPFYRAGKQFVTEFSWRVTNGNADLFGTVDTNTLRNTLNLVVTNGKCVWTDTKGINCEGEILNPEPIARPIIAKRTVQIEYPTSWTNTMFAWTLATATSYTTRQVTRPTGSLTACLTTFLMRCVIVRDYDAAGNIIGDGALKGGSGILQTSRIRLYPDLPKWFTDNHWHELALGAVGLGSVPGAGGTCPCLIITLDGSMGRSDVKFLIMMAGRPLAGQSRPSTGPSNYFDSINNRNVTNGQSFDQQTVLTNSFNDRLHY